MGGACAISADAVIPARNGFPVASSIFFCSSGSIECRRPCAPTICKPRSRDNRTMSLMSSFEMFAMPGMSPPDVDARLVHLEREPRDALVLRNAGVGACEQHSHVGDLTAGRPHLLSVDDELAVLLDRFRRQTREVRTRAGLAEELAPRTLSG